MKQTMGGAAKTCRPGDNRHIGKAVVHSGRTTETRTAADAFAEPERFHFKEGQAK